MCGILDIKSLSRSHLVTKLLAKRLSNPSISLLFHCHHPSPYSHHLSSGYGGKELSSLPQSTSSPPTLYSHQSQIHSKCKSCSVFTMFRTLLHNILMMKTKNFKRTSIVWPLLLLPTLLIALWTTVILAFSQLFNHVMSPLPHAYMLFPLSKLTYFSPSLLLTPLFHRYVLRIALPDTPV